VAIHLEMKLHKRYMGEFTRND